MGHGSGGRLSAELVREVFLPLFNNPAINALGDAGVFTLDGKRFALTTDSFTVRPIFFPGGNIGKLAACGMINDLAVSGARPIFLSAGFILEEGLALEDLRAIAGSLAQEARGVGAQLVAGDTKVIEGQAGLLINTTGLGQVLDCTELGPGRITEGDTIIVTGTVGDHGLAVLLARGELGISASFPSDCAPLWELLEPLYQGLGAAVKFARDPTRGGLVTVLNEAVRPGLDFVLDEALVPLLPAVESASEMLGLDPLYAACEGRAVLFVAPDKAEEAISILNAHPLGRAAAAIGRVVAGEGLVIGVTRTGGKRVLDMLVEDQYPRIC